MYGVFHKVLSDGLPSVDCPRQGERKGGGFWVCTYEHKCIYADQVVWVAQALIPEIVSRPQPQFKLLPYRIFNFCHTTWHYGCGRGRDLCVQDVLDRG